MHSARFFFLQLEDKAYYGREMVFLFFYSLNNQFILPRGHLKGNKDLKS